MAIYVVSENVKLNSGDKQLKKNMMFSESDVSPENLKMWLRKGYVKKFKEITEEEEEANTQDDAPFYLTAEYYLEPKDVNRLRQAELVEYGQHIGVPDFDTKANVATLKKQINTFIENVDDDEDEPKDKNEPKNNENGEPKDKDAPKNSESGEPNVGG